MMPIRVVFGFALAGLVACANPLPTPDVSPVPSPLASSGESQIATPEASATPTPSAAGSATDVVLRLTVYEGPSPRTVIEPPEFTLYADGLAIYSVKSRAPDELWPTFELDSAQLTSEQASALVADALGPGGLRDARDEYGTAGIPLTDLGWNYFDVRADGVVKQVRVYGLDYDAAPDAAIRAKFAGLAERLLNFPAEVNAGGAVYMGAFEPQGYEATLSVFRPDDLDVSADWPWHDLALADFEAAPDGNLLHDLTRAQGERVLDLGITEYLIVRGTDGNKYFIHIRPLLPDEHL